VRNVRAPHAHRKGRLQPVAKKAALRWVPLAGDGRSRLAVSLEDSVQMLVDVPPIPASLPPHVAYASGVRMLG